MARYYRCDACGKFYMHNETKIKFAEHLKPTICVSLISGDGTIDKRFDLCDECLSKVLDMLHIESVKENTNGEEEN